MLVITRFRVPPAANDDFTADLRAVVDALAARPGLVDSYVGRNLDEPTLWTLTTRWQSVGAYRRALSAYDVKLATARPYAFALEEPSAYTDTFDDVVADDVVDDTNPSPGAPRRGNR
ncbi:antibiotic biosynthesis monooxygenase [Mumia zhuanghuii]|uniref:Antibiotic biosynthesis monooxygenase family protein n=2 Tax=Mumia TaxID=1546255 RepID=A0ABW1QNW3_9ACTN|nr:MULTISPECIES: antibiotic biosynthesis monooxygenase family protein [Mumia]KAA1420432.1 antibiotic biosynthesis monooxygenase [Mumia zhuanghuii]